MPQDNDTTPLDCEGVRKPSSSHQVEITDEHRVAVVAEILQSLGWVGTSGDKPWITATSDGRIYVAGALHSVRIGPLSTAREFLRLAGLLHDAS